MIRQVEKYEVLEEIGHGGMATVYRARDTKLDRLVALKIMHPHLKGAKEARARFRREAQSVARLKHDRVLEIYDYSGEESEESYIAAELLTGPTLRKWSDEHAPIPAEAAAAFAIEMCRALGAAHDKGIVHRDVKPENILLHENRELKLTDFGIADMVDSQSMTATGQILGSPGHMAPEQIEGGHADARTDVFALGTVLYLLVTGRLPFTGKNPHQILKRIVDGEYPDPLRLAPAIGGGMKAVLARALSKDAAGRYASAKEMEDALAGLLAELGLGDAHDEVVRFLADPVARTKELNALAKTRSLELGKKAKDAGRVAEAQDQLGRVLALDEGNAEALALLARIGDARDREAATRRLVIGVAAAIALIAGVAGVAQLVGGGGGAGGADAGVPITTADREDASAASAIDAGPGDAGALDAGIDASSDAGTDVGVDAWELVADPIRPRITPLAPRHVVFRPDPVNVNIGIDGAPPVSFTTLHETELAPGRHTFTFASNVDCCLSETFVVDIPAGPGATEIGRRLASRPARLRVNANLFADVVISGVRGRTNGLIDVPIRAASREETFPYTVTAPGHRAYTGEVTLRAGDDTVITVTLEPEGAP
jgi:serine/threonine-protein kinase